MSDVIVETLDWDSKPTPIDHSRCRVLIHGTARQCKNPRTRDVQGKGMCEIHFKSLQRGKRYAFQKDTVK
jgi:hypothetical protein